MKILVCIKQVPDMEASFRVNADGSWYDEADLAWRTNEYDGFAVEQAVLIKERQGDSIDITVLCIGPDRVKEAIKKSLAMGCDRGVLVKDDESHKKDPFQIAAIIAEFAKDKGFDLIFTGMQSQDRGSAQVGVLLAEMLGLNVITTVVGFDLTDGQITARRELEGGIKALVKGSLPMVITCQLGLNTPRFPILPNIIKAKKKELLSVAVGDLLKVEKLLGSETLYVPEKKGGGLILEGEIDTLADQLINVLKEKTSLTVFRR